jgi:hypothetical protein
MTEHAGTTGEERPARDERGRFGPGKGERPMTTGRLQRRLGALEAERANPSYSPRSLLKPCKGSLLKALAARTAGQPPHFAGTL